MALIEVEKLEKTYHTDGVDTHALRSATFNINAGEFVAIMGPSGSGKSTLLHMLGFLDRSSGGTYRFDGKTIDEYPPSELAHVRNSKMGFVFQSFNLLARSSVRANVQLPLMYSRVPEGEWDDRATAAIELVGLSHRAEYMASQLSGGEKQRVAIARALINNPDVIFADEPTGNLDSKSGQVVMETIQQLNEKNKHTIILITHETQTAEHAERIITIRDGMVESDRPVPRRRSATDRFSK